MESSSVIKLECFSHNTISLKSDQIRITYDIDWTELKPTEPHF